MQKYIYVILHKFSVWELKIIDSQQETQYNREMQLSDLGDSPWCFERPQWLHLREENNKKNRPPKHMASRPNRLESSKVLLGLQISHDVPQRFE
jgi:hypothetical protein